MQPPAPLPLPRAGWINHVVLVLVVFHAAIVAPMLALAIGGVLVQVLGLMLAFPLWLVLGIPLFMAYHYGAMVPARLPLGGAGALPETLREMLMQGVWPVAALGLCCVAGGMGLWLVYRAAWRALRAGGAVHAYLHGGGTAVCLLVTACLSLMIPALLWFAPDVMWALRQPAYALAHLTPTPEMGALMAFLFLMRWTATGTPQRWLGLAMLALAATVSIYGGVQFRLLAIDHQQSDGGFAAALQQRLAELDHSALRTQAVSPIANAAQEIPGLRFPADLPGVGLPDLGRWHRPPADPQR